MITEKSLKGILFLFLLVFLALEYYLIKDTKPNSWV